MESQLVFTFKDLLLLILWGSLVTLFVYLILILRRVLKIVKSVNLIVDDNKTSIDSTIAIVPELAKHAEVISSEVAHDIQSFRTTIDNISETTESVTGTIKENKGFADGLASFMHSVSIGKVLYDKYFSKKVKDIKEAANDVNETILKAKEKDTDNETVSETE